MSEKNTGLLKEHNHSNEAKGTNRGQHHREGREIRNVTNQNVEGMGVAKVAQLSDTPPSTQTDKLISTHTARRASALRGASSVTILS